MKATELIDEVGELLGEDFSNNPLWSKVELLKDLKVIVQLFGELTLLVDRCSVRLLDYNTGEMTLPGDFGQMYFGQYSQDFLDVVDLGETEFLDTLWAAQGKEVPQGITTWGIGGDAKGKVIPVPTTIEVPAGSGSAVASIGVADSGAGVWTVVCTNGVLVTSSGGSASAVQVVEGFGNYWDLGVSTSGELTLTASSSTTSSDLVLEDTILGGINWSITAGLGGVLVSDLAQGGPGVLTGLIVSEGGVDTYQDFNSDYGILVDAYATGVSVSPEHVVKVSSDYGFTLYGSQYLGEGTVWYKGLPQDVHDLFSEVVISDGLLPIIKHGVLARALAKDGDGQDLDKSKFLANVFLSECGAIKDTFGKRW
jgi:hypothetical protein